MNNRIRYLIRREIRALFELKKTERLWHVPLLASLCVGIPLLTGLCFDKLSYGILSCTGGLVILYLPATSLKNRMMTLLVCSVGFMVSLGIGIVFSFDPFISSLMLGLFAFSVHWITHYLNMKPPGNFFFIMLASIGACTPFDLSTIPIRIGLIGLGCLLACVLALLYSLIAIKKYSPKKMPAAAPKRIYAGVVESVIIGVFMGSSLLTAKLLAFDNPYWVPISCIAVLQGISRRHVWQRSFQRILGTYLGLGMVWMVLSFHLSNLGICISILVLQFIVEMIVVRHYALAVIFITPLTILLAEAGKTIPIDPNKLVSARFIDIVLGSLIGAVGGWFLHHQRLKKAAERQIRKTRVAILRR